MTMVAAALALWLAVAGMAEAYPMITSQIPNGPRVPCPSPDTPGCQNGFCPGVGHNTCIGGSLPLNAFGRDLRDSNFAYTKELCAMDSDGDGLTNGEELGDPCCLWAPGEDKLLASSNVQDLSHPGFASSSLPARRAEEQRAACASLAVDSAVTPTETEAPEYSLAHIYLPDEDQHTLDIVPAAPWKVPSDRVTTYRCIFFEYPKDKEYHIVGVEPLVDNLATLHHMMLYACDTNVRYTAGDMVDCDGMPPVGTEAHGVFTTPDEAGFLIGKGHSEMAVLQVHQDNPNLRDGMWDASGLRLHMTSKLRPNSIGDIWAGPVAFGFRIPPGRPAWDVGHSCEWGSDAMIFATRGHMHKLGTTMGTVLKRQPPGARISWFAPRPEPELVAEVGIIERFNYDLQTVTPANGVGSGPLGVAVKAGDTLETHCIFDASKRTATTDAGIDTVDEMCINHLFYYPKRDGYFGEPFCIGRIWQGDGPSS